MSWNYLFPSVSGTPDGAMATNAQQIRNTLTKDTIKNKLVFEVRVLTPCVKTHMSTIAAPLPPAEEAERRAIYENAMADTTNVATHKKLTAEFESATIATTLTPPPLTDNTYSFFGRIEDDPNLPFISPHAQISDPCEISATAKPTYALELIKLHTQFISKSGYARNGPEPVVGDRVQVVLDKGDISYNLQYCYFEEISNTSDKEILNEMKEAECLSLEMMFENFDEDTDLSTYAGLNNSGGANISESPGSEGLGPSITAPSAEVLPTDFFKALLDRSDDSTVYPAIVTNADDTEITEAHTPIASGWSITSRPQTQRCITSVSIPRCSPHRGVDIGAPMRTQLYATYPGVITYKPSTFPTAATTNAVATITSKIEFADGSTKTIEIKYMHMSAYNAATPHGSIVQQGQKIGLSGGDPTTPGSGGRAWSSGPHLHWEVRIDGVVQASHYMYRATRIAPEPWYSFPSSTPEHPEGDESG
jgi:murein DD-endopeptidase MepM/ murein hydrolase activator NlpD